MPTCKMCGETVGANWIRKGVCVACQQQGTTEPRRSKVADARAAAAELETRAGRIVLTTEASHNLPVTERLGIVTAECVFGMHFFRDAFALGRDVFGGRSGATQKTLREAREAALAELRLEAVALGADAVVGIDLDYSEISGGGKSMLFLVASGTAVALASPVGSGSPD